MNVCTKIGITRYTVQHYNSAYNHVYVNRETGLRQKHMPCSVAVDVCAVV